MYDQEDKHMKHASELIKDFESEQYNELLTDIYVDEHLLAVGCAQLLNGRHSLPRAGYGRTAAGAG